MIRLKFKIVVTMVLLAGGVLLTAVAQEASNANSEKARADKAAAEAEFAAVVVLDDDRENQDRDDARRREERRDLNGESQERGDLDREREDAREERQHRERAAREREEFERHVDVMRREIQELVKSGRGEQAERLEQKLREQIEEFRKTHLERREKAERIDERMERVHHAVDLLRNAAEQLHLAGIHEPAEEIVEFSEKIARHAPRELLEHRHRDDERRHDEEHEHAVASRELQEVLESHGDRIHRMEVQLDEIRQVLQSIQRRSEKDEE